MAKLQSNSMGFLQGGTPVNMSELKALWGRMQQDISAIRKALELGERAPAIARVGGAGRSSANAANLQRAPSASTAAVASAAQSSVQAQGRQIGRAIAKAVASEVQGASASPRRRDSSGRFAGAAASSALAKTDISRAVQQVAESSSRDSRGRFVGGSGGEGGDAGALGRSGVLDRLTSAISGMNANDEIDPAIKAFNEVAQPLSRGYQALFGGGSKEEKMHTRWYRRIWSQLRKGDDEQRVNDKAMRKSLKVLEDKPVGNGGSSGLLSNLGSAMGGGMLSSVLGAGGGVLKMLGRGAGGLLKRLPLVGGLMASIGGMFEAWDSETSDMSRGDKDRKTGGALGGIGGTLAGGFAGAKMGGMLGAFAGPVGIAIGSLVGGAAGLFFGESAGRILGETVGGWVTSLRDADIPGKIAAGWDVVTSTLSAAGDWIRETAGEAFAFVQSAWDTVTKPIGELVSTMKDLFSGLADSINEFIKDKFGIDMKAGLARASEVVQDVKGAVTEKASAAWDGAKSLGSKAWEGAKSAATYAQENTLVGKGATIVAASAKQMFGNPRKDALLKEMDAQGIQDPKERAMLLAQVDHESNGFRAGEESFKYRSADRVMEVSKSAAKHGKPAIEAAMKQGPEALAELMYGGRMGNKDAGDGFKFRGRGNLQITGRDNYKALGAKLGLDLENNPDLLNDPAIAAKASVQWWKDSGAGAKARAGDVKGVTKVVNGGYNGLDHRAELFGQYMASPITSPAAVAVASAPPSAPNAAVAAPMQAKEAPSVPVSVASLDAGAGRGFSNPPLVEPGQDMQDRRIAHIATGGISAG